MADSGTARSVSGEMMAAGLMSGGVAAGTGDVMDADYVEVVPEARSRPPTPRLAPVAGPRGMAMLDRRNESMRRRGPSRGGPLFWLAGGVAAMAAFWISGGHSMVRSDIVASAAVDGPELRIANVRSRAETMEGIESLVVDGDIRNEGSLSGKVPALAVQVVSREGETTVYRLGTLRTPLAPGAKYSFSGRLDMPKDGVKTVSVAFDL